jgi:choline-glycine betaine transporter
LDIFQEDMGKPDLKTTNLSREDALYLTQLLVTITNIEEAQSVLGYQCVSGIVTRKPLEEVVKLFALLVVSLFLLVMLSLRDVQSVVPNFSLPVVITLLTWSALSLAELAQEVRDLQDERNTVEGHRFHAAPFSSILLDYVSASSIA